MIKKRGLVKLIAAALVFAAFDIWIFTSLLGSYRKYETANSLKEVTLFARTAPEEKDNIGEWITSLPGVIEGGRILFLDLDEYYNFVPLAGDSLARALWDANKDSREFQEGLSSVYYLLPYLVSRSFKTSELRNLSGIDPGDIVSSMRVYLIPVPDESGYDINGAVLMAVPEEGALAFENLLRNLAILAWVIFTVILAVAVLARDPITGYAVIFMFAFAIAFVAYPLFESVRLTFIQQGKFTFDIWKDAVSARHLSALWGSTQLGIITASVSTFVGFIFAFLLERTGIRGKKIIGTMATMPVISPPFSLTLSIILLFGNNGLITKQLLGLSNFSVYGLGGLEWFRPWGCSPLLL
jgi:iron(III) transport system permease protein